VCNALAWELTGCYHTKFISTSPKADFPNTVRMEFHEDRAYETAKEIVRTAVENFPNRVPEKLAYLKRRRNAWSASVRGYHQCPWRKP